MTAPTIVKKIVIVIMMMVVNLIISYILGYILKLPFWYLIIIVLYLEVMEIIGLLIGKRILLI